MMWNIGLENSGPHRDDFLCYAAIARELGEVLTPGEVRLAARDAYEEMRRRLQLEEVACLRLEVRCLLLP